MSPVDLVEILPIIEEAFNMGKTVKLKASGNSMMPLLKSGRDGIILSKCENPQNLKKYDIPLYFRDERTLILHRIVKVKEDCFDMCGDDEIKIEEDVKKENVVAIAIGFIRKGKTFYVNNLFYRIYSVLWCSILPWRKRVLAFGRKLVRIGK